jgi:hypothetical protein
MRDRVRNVEIDGRAVSDAQFRHLALNSYGHFTAMQMRGLGRHLARLTAANHEMFGVAPDPDRASGTRWSIAPRDGADHRCPGAPVE